MKANIPTLELILDDLDELKKAYAAAVKAEQESFTFRNAKLVTTYAKYLIELAEL